MLGFGNAMAEEAIGEIPTVGGVAATVTEWIIRARRRGRR